MRTKLLLLGPALSLAAAGPALGFAGTGSGNKPCTECHKLTQDEAKGILKNLVEKVLSVEASEVQGLWVIDVESRGRKGPLYLDFSKKYLVSGNVIRLETMENLTQTRMTDLNRVDVSKIPLGDAVVIGKSSAKHKIVVFDDPECPYCQKLQTEMNLVVSKRDDVAFYIKMFPLASHPTAFEKAKAIVCEKSAQLLEDSLAGKPIPPPKCETKQIEENIALGQKLGINSTPTLILPDGRVLPGYRPADKILELIDGTPSKSSQR